MSSESEEEEEEEEEGKSTGREPAPTISS